MSRVVAVLPFAADDIDPDANDLARWVSLETAANLDVAGVVEARAVVDSVELEPQAIGEAAAQLGAEAALGGSLGLRDGAVDLTALLIDAHGAVKAEWTEQFAVGAALTIPQMLARAVLLALGEDASAAPATVEAEHSSEAVLGLCRAARQLSEGDADGLLMLVQEQPALEAPRRLLLQAARAALGTDQMPAMYTAIEKLAEALPDDAEVLIALGDYRSVHLDEQGAREAFLKARESAEDPALTAQASGRLASLAETAGRTDEAILHLRAAVKMADDPQLYARLGELLAVKEPAEGLQMLTRATVLAPRDPALHLRLAKAIREHGGDPARALSAAARAAELCKEEGDLADEIRAELEQLLA